MQTSNTSIAKLLRTVAAALAIKKASIFQIRAYETAADGIEHSTSEIKDIFDEGKLDEIPGVGENIARYLEEYFKNGKVAHFESLTRGIDPVVFDLLEIPGVGPKTAQELAKLGILNIADLERKLKDGDLQNKGFSVKIAEKILIGLLEKSQNPSRMLLPYAYEQAKKALEYLKKSPDVIKADTLGSLRRRVVTIGDLDFAASSKNPQKVIEYFVKMPGVVRILDQGENMAHVVLHSGLELDLLVGLPESYGALLQHFTGSKHHNIKLRSYALKKGYSLSEYGVSRGIREKEKGGKGNTIPTKTEEELYELLGMQTPPPEIREDVGEIEAAIAHKIPRLVELNDIKGDLHLHSNFPLQPSHGPGANEIEEIIQKAIEQGYDFVGISDHPPGFTTHSKEQITEMIAKRTVKIAKLQSTKSIRVLNGLEIDILTNGALSVPDEVLKTLDYCIAGIHSGHRQTGKDQMTKRILAALESPYVNIISHPTGRLLNQRESYEADWETIFKFCAKNKKLLEINAFPNRLDLRDDLIRDARKFGVKFIINTDAHEISQMENMEYGVSLARRGWLTKEDIINTWDWKKLKEWFNI